MLYPAGLGSHSVMFANIKDDRLNVAVRPIGMSNKGFCVVHHEILWSAAKVFEGLHNALYPELLSFALECLSVYQSAERQGSNEHTIAMYLGELVHPDQFVTCVVDFHDSPAT